MTPRRRHGGLAGARTLALGLSLALLSVGCGGGGGGLKVPAAPTQQTGGAAFPGTGVGASASGQSTVYVDGDTLAALAGRNASAAASCAASPFLVKNGALTHCRETPTGPGASLTVTVTAGGQTYSQTLAGSNGVSFKNLPPGVATLNVGGVGPGVGLGVTLVGDVALHLRALTGEGSLSLYGAYSGSVNPTRFRQVDMVGFALPAGGEALWHTDNGVSFADKNGDGQLGPGDEPFYDQDFDGADDDTDTDDDNDAIADSQDADDDNDGLTDNQDTQDTDDDNDGQPDLTDPDDGDRDNDGIPDASDTTDDPFFKNFALTQNGVAVTQAVVGATLTLAATTEPAGAVVSYRVSGGVVSGNTWTLPANPGEVTVTALLTGASAPQRRTLRLSLGSGAAASLTHDPAGVTLPLGQTYALQFVVKDALGNVLGETPALTVSGAAVTLLSGGVIRAQATGQSQVIATLGGLSASVLVNVPDSHAPTLTLNDTVPATTISPFVTVTGFVNDPTIGQVVVSGGEAPVTLPVKDGFFSGQVRLAIGVATLTVTATDGAGNTATATVSTTRLQDQSPTLSLSPLPVVTLGTDVLLAGALTDNNTTFLNVTAENGFGQLITFEEGAGGSFSFTVPLVTGLNTLTFTATDAVENTLTQTLTITRLENGLRSLVSDKTGQTLLPGQSVIFTLDAGTLIGASASVWLPGLNTGVALADNGAAPDLLAGDGLYTGTLVTPGAGAFGDVTGVATLTDPQGGSGTLTAGNLFVFDARPVVGGVTCSCAGTTLRSGDVATFTLSASAWPATGTATLALDGNLGNVTLADTDGDGQYTGQLTTPAFGTGTFGGVLTFTDPLGNVRENTLTGLITIDNTPVCAEVSHNATGTLVGGNVVHVRVNCGQGTGVTLSFKNGGTFLVQGLILRDDATGGDPVAGDSLFEADLTMPSCLEIPNGVIAITFTDLHGNAANHNVGSPVAVLAEPGINTFTTSITAGGTVRGGTPVTFTVTAPEAGGTATVNALTLSETYTLTDQGGGTYAATVNLPVSGSFDDVDMQAFFANATCPNVASDPLVLADYFDLDNTPLLSNFTHGGTGGGIFTGGQNWEVSVQGPASAQSVTVQIIGLADTFTLTQVADLGGGQGQYSASLVVPGAGSVDGADVKVTFTDSVGNTGTATLTTSMTVDNTAPTQVSDLTAQASGTLARLNFSRPSTDTTGYRIERSAEGQGSFTNSFLLSSSAATVTWEDTAVSAGGTYAYRVVAIDRVGLESPASTQAAATVGTPQAPALNRPIPRGTDEGGGLKLTWPSYLGSATINTVKIYKGFSDAVGSADPGSIEVLSHSLVTFQALANHSDTVTSSEVVYYYRAEIWTDFGEHATSEVVSQSVGGLWQLYVDSATAPNDVRLVRRLLGGDDGDVSGGADNAEAGSVHYSLTTGLTGLTAASRLKVDAAKGVMVVTRPTAGAVSVLDLAGNVLGETTGLSNPTLLELDLTRRYAYTVTGSGPYGVTRLDYNTPASPVATAFGVDVQSGTLSTTSQPRAIAVDSGTGRVFVEGVSSGNQSNNSNSSSSFSMNFTETGGLAGNGNITASADLGAIASLVDANVDLTMTLTLRRGGASIPANDPVVLSVSVNGKPFKHVAWAGHTDDLNVIPPLQFPVPRSFFKLQTGSPDTIEIENLGAHQYQGRVTSASTCPAPTGGATYSWCYVNSSNKIDLRITTPTDAGLGKYATRRAIGVYESSGTELGWITDSLSTSDLIATSDGHLFVGEDWTPMGASSSSNKTFSIVYNTAFTAFRSNPLYDGTGNPVGSRQFLSLSSRNDVTRRNRGLPDGGTPKIGWVGQSRLHAASPDSGLSQNLWFSLPLYRFSNSTALASRTGPSAETMPYAVTLCANPGNTTACSNPHTPSWMYVGFAYPTAMAQDAENRRLYVCDTGAQKVYVFHDTAQSVPAACANTTDGDATGLDDDSYSACNTVATPGNLFKGETSLVGAACELAVARP